MKDQNYGMKALWDYVRKLGPLGSPATNYEALWKQMCERCDELDKKLAQIEQQWVGLDEADIAALDLPVAKARALEALLRRRNT